MKLQETEKRIMMKTGLKKKTKSLIGAMIMVLIGLAFFIILPPQEAHASSTITLQPGETYDCSAKSSYKKYGALYVDIKKDGYYTLEGSACNTMVRIDPKKGDTVTVNLNGVRLTPNDDAPGYYSDRAAIEIGDSGGTVILRATYNKVWDDSQMGNIFEGQGRMPAIRKDTTSTKLVFQAKDDDQIIIARADPKAFRTCAIGCYSKDAGIISRLYSNTTGNIYFEKGTIYAYGSRDFTNGGKLGYDRWDGGPAIGAGSYGSVDGLTINGGNIYAYAGDTGCAAIGTSSQVDTGPLFSCAVMCGQANNITINGGNITIGHFAVVGSKGATLSGMGAGIGSGYCGTVDNLVINGGNITVDKDYHYPYVGIGGGEEGDAKYIEINGGNIDLEVKQVGIGTFAIKETDVLGDTAWLGDVKLKINGGDIKITSDKECLGGGAPDNKKSYVEINGGNLDLHSKAITYCPVIGPTCYKGKLVRITINGGIINAHRDYNSYNDEHHVPMIGTPHYPSLTDHLANNSIVNKIEITGGTIRLTETNDKKPGKIGGNKGVDYNRDYTDVYISGGNIYANMLDDRIPLDESGDNKLKCYKIKLNGDTTYSERDFANVEEEKIVTRDNDAIAYGIKDCRVFKASPELWFWLPEDSEWGMIKTDYAPFSSLSATVFSGNLYHDKAFYIDENFYPPVYLNLIAGEAPDREKDGSGMLLYADKALSGFQPVDDSGWPKVIDSYNSAKTGGFPVLDRNGGFISLEGSYFEDGRWVYIGGNGTFDPDIFDPHKGMDLYATVGDFDLALKFDENIPESTESKLSGTMPQDAEYHNDDTITLPTDYQFHPYYHFWLNGYKFIGWNTKADGTGKQYESGQSGVPASEFRKSSSDPSEITLYAQWEPIKYEVSYTSTSVSVPKSIKVEYTYDTPAKVAWSDDLQDWGDQRKLIAGWYDEDGKIYGNNSELLNFVDFNDNGEQVTKTLYALWMDKGELRIRIATDGQGVSGLEDDISIENENGSIPETKFEEDSDNPGTYVNVCDTPILSGTYTVTVGERPLDPDEATFEYDRNTAGFTELNSYTTTITKPEYVTAVTMEPMDGTDDEGRPYAVLPKGYKIKIDAQGNSEQGRIADGWKCKGVTPEWDPSKTKQVITVKGTSELTPNVRGVKYTVVFDPNDGAYQGSEPATGKMDPQEFTVGELQKLSKATFKKKGYEQGGTGKGYWSTTPSGPGRFLWDQAEIGDYSTPNGYPLSNKDGDTVTLYAQWVPLEYSVVYHDPSGTYQDSSFQGSYNRAFDLPNLTDTAVLPGWGEREGFELYGWKARDISDEQIRKPGEKAVNLCTLNDDDTATGYTMDAVWVEKGSIDLVLTLDGESLSGKASDIKLTDGSQVYENYFTEDPSVAGRYVYKRSDDKTLSQGTYNIVIDGFDIPQTSAFDYDPAVPSELKYDFYTVSVDKDDNITSAGVSAPGGTPADSVVTLNGSQVDISAEAAEGYHFDGWSWLGDEGEPQWEDGKDKTIANQRITVNKTLKLTAHAEGNVYSVSYDPNNEAYPGTNPATGSMDNQDMVYGEPQRLFNNGFTKEGYQFLCWNTQPDGEGDSYGNLKAVHNLTTVEGETVKLYAIWEPREYTITYVDPYRFCKTQKQTVKYDEPASLKPADDPDWQPAGHALLGWEGEPLGSFYSPGTQVTNFCSVNEDGSLTGKVLKAAWNDEGSIRVIITLDDIGVDVDPDDIELISDSDGTKYSGCFVAESDNPGRYMYDPSGLIDPDEPDPDSVDVEGLLPEGDYTVHLNNYKNYGLADAQVKIYYDSVSAASAQLASDTVAVEAGSHVSSVKIKDPVSGAEGDSIVVVRGNKAIVSAVVDETGYHFDSYAFSGSIPDMNLAEANQEITVYGPVTLTAQAAPNVYYIHYDANKGKGTKGDQPVTYDHKDKLAANTFTRAHYYFTGWNTNSSGSGTAYKDKQEIINLASEEGDVVTLYAQWKQLPKYTVSFVTNGGSKIASQTVEKGSTAKKPKAPTRNGFSFAGWYANKNLTKPYDFSKKITANTTIYAKWNEAKVPVLMAQGKASKRTIKTSWNKVDGASKYLVYGAKCGDKLKRIKVTSANSFKVKKIKGKKLKKHSPYIFRVVAVDKKGKVIAISKEFHVIAGKTMGDCANVKKITANKRAVTISKGKSVKVSAKLTLPKGKKHIGKAHGPKLKFTSDTPGVATVSKDGTVKAKAPGKATIYIQDTSGIYCKTVITVK